MAQLPYGPDRLVFKIFQASPSESSAPASQEDNTENLAFLLGIGLALIYQVKLKSFHIMKEEQGAASSGAALPFRWGYACFGGVVEAKTGILHMGMEESRFAVEFLKREENEFLPFEVSGDNFYNWVLE